MPTAPIETTRSENIRVSAIGPHPKNPRTALGDLTEMAESIRNSGIVEPLIVAPGKAKNKYILIAGHRRLAAAKKAGRSHVPCIIRDDLTTDRAQLEVMVLENSHRIDLNVVEEGNAYQALLDFPDVDLKTLAANTGHKQKTIKDRIKLAQSPEPVQAKLIAKQITTTDALTLTEFAEDPDVHAQLASALGTSQFGFLVEREREQRAWRKTAAKITKDLTDTGVRVTDLSTLDEEETTAVETDAPFVWQEVASALEIPEGAKTVAVLDEDMEDNVRWFYRHDTTGTAETGDGSAAGEKKPAPKTETPAQARVRLEREQQEQLKKDLKTSATVRRKFLAQTAAENDADRATSALRILLMERATASYRGPAIHELIGLPPLSSDDDAKNEKAIERHIYKMPLAQLAVTAFLLDRHAEELSLETPWQWTRDDPQKYSKLVAWHNDLVELFGYEYAECEKPLLQIYDARLADADQE
ncbi:hypothetical protein CH300_20000 [Rhodococcus sp. 15-1154-1]|nr:ParB/RepB/Spo0J family partition protein [Rhodococcus sp. 15-1154-1]OZF00827.1 hypothetical protein CH300_20000 [Rhodococcus sp. 15-1154-1]